MRLLLTEDILRCRTVHSLRNPQLRDHPCILSVIAYALVHIRSYYSYRSSCPALATWKRAMPWKKVPLQRGFYFIINLERLSVCILLRWQNRFLLESNISMNDHLKSCSFKMSSSILRSQYMFWGSALTPQRICMFCICWRTKNVDITTFSFAQVMHRSIGTSRHAVWASYLHV
jgi:hypothetical protein